MTNGLWQVDIVVNRRGASQPVSAFSVWVFSPESSTGPFRGAAVSEAMNDRVRKPDGARAFTILEMMIAITILSLIVAAIYATWTAILRASKAGRDVSAAVQRSRIALRVLEDSLTSAQSFVANQRYYGFVAENGTEPMLSFVARLAKSFPRAGKFGDLDVRRVSLHLGIGQTHAPTSPPRHGSRRG